MRLVWLTVLAIAACDSGPNEGAILTFETPDGAMTATRLEIVLANAAVESISDIDNQRREPGSNAGEAVRYYRQRAVGGTIQGSTAVAGFQLRIEPDTATSTDEKFIPFVLAYDADRLIGIGAIADANGDPTYAQITPGTVTSYTITMGAMQSDAGADTAIARGMARVVSCGRADAAWTSGVAWLPSAGSGHQLRLLLPDRSDDPLATDATARSADLDCDAHAADANDCDDLRGTFYRGAAESCDGLDTNCDAEHYLAQSCNAASSTCQVGPSKTGVQFCDDETGTLGACSATAECACAQGQCISCAVDFVGATTKQACSPSIGKVKLPMCEDGLCTVEVAAATNDWRGYIGMTETGSFATKLTDVHNQLYLEVKRSGSLPVTATSIGEVYLVVTRPGAITTVPVRLVMNAQANACVPISMGSGSQMICTQ